MKKTRRIEIRLTDDEFDMFQEKLSSYPNLTRLIIDAVNNFDNRGGANKLQALNEWAIEFAKYNDEISKIGSNINQLAHYVNIMKLQNYYNEEIISSCIIEIGKYNSLFKSMVELQRKFTKNVVKI